MDKPVLIIEMPKLSNEQIAGIHNFLQALMNAFETHYTYQLREYYRQSNFNDNSDEIF